MAKKPDPRSRPATLEARTLKAVQESLELVQAAEMEITRCIRLGTDTAKALDTHHHLRLASLALLIAYSIQSGLPDPRENYTTKEPK